MGGKILRLTTLQCILELDGVELATTNIFRLPPEAGRNSLKTTTPSAIRRSDFRARDCQVIWSKRGKAGISLEKSLRKGGSFRRRWRRYSRTCALHLQSSM